MRAAGQLKRSSRLSWVRPRSPSTSLSQAPSSSRDSRPVSGESAAAAPRPPAPVSRRLSTRSVVIPDRDCRPAVVTPAHSSRSRLVSGRPCSAASPQSETWRQADSESSVRPSRPDSAWRPWSVTRSHCDTSRRRSRRAAAAWRRDSSEIWSHLPRLSDVSAAPAGPLRSTSTPRSVSCGQRLTSRSRRDASRASAESPSSVSRVHRASESAVRPVLAPATALNAASVTPRQRSARREVSPVRSERLDSPAAVTCSQPDRSRRASLGRAVSGPRPRSLIAAQSTRSTAVTDFRRIDGSRPSTLSQSWRLEDQSRLSRADIQDSIWDATSASVVSNICTLLNERRPGRFLSMFSHMNGSRTHQPPSLKSIDSIPLNRSVQLRGGDCNHTAGRSDFSSFAACFAQHRQHSRLLHRSAGTSKLNI
mmetsp:Transcript_33051/g.78390  ORF Transcript_33051/g.78390 Transcript_33051/m.78390 type:complete len:422 (+) Transcript_33051:1318-2583(+)